MVVAKNALAILWDPTMMTAMMATDNAVVNQGLEDWIAQIVCLDSGDSHQKAAQNAFHASSLVIYAILIPVDVFAQH